MMFKPDNRMYPAGHDNLHCLRLGERRPISIKDIRCIFGGNAPFVRVYKVAREKDVAGNEVVKVVSRDYHINSFSAKAGGTVNQIDEFIGDIFDISLTHRIVGLGQPWNLYVEETEDHGLIIDFDAIEAIVGRV